VVAISVDPPGEGAKMTAFIESAFPVLGDPRKLVISSYGIEHQMGSETLANMGYVIVDGSGQVRHRVVDPSFGQHANEILAKLRALKPSP
jgi:peroxiredoxin